MWLTILQGGAPQLQVGLQTIITPINYSYIYHKATYKAT